MAKPTTRQALLRLLKTRGPQTAGELSAALGVTAALLLTRDEDVQPVVDVDVCQFTDCD